MIFLFREQVKVLESYHKILSYACFGSVAGTVDFFSSRQYVSDLWKETVQMSGCFGLMCSVAPRGEQLEQLVSSVSWSDM